MQELKILQYFIKKFSFVKHRGKYISDVCASDIGYINCMQKNMDLDLDMKYTIDKIMSNI